MGDQMKEKYYNRKSITYIMYTISFIFLLVGIIILFNIIEKESWKYISLPLIIISLGLMALACAVNRGNCVIIDYNNKEVISNIPFNKKNQLCIPFDAIIDAYIINDIQLSKEIRLKKYPKKILVIKRQYYNEYIPLKWFNDNVIDSLLNELIKVRDNNENFI